MLVEFSVKNFKSFKEMVTLSMVSAPIKEHLEENTFKVSDNLSLLKNAVIYGANAGGKSNLLHAMLFMRNFIINSSKESQANEPIKVSRFKLSTVTEKEPAIFEIVFIHKDIRYRYGFAVTEDAVVEEWLYYVPNKQEVKVFIRKRQEFDLSKHFESEKSLVNEKRVRPNALLLSVSAQFNGAIAGNVLDWIRNFNCISNIDSLPNVTFDLFKKDKKKVLEMLKNADMGIEDLSVSEKEGKLTDLPLELQKLLASEKLIRLDVKSSHKKYDANGKFIDFVDFNFPEEESHGTLKYFELIGPVIDTLMRGKVLVIDELDSQLHSKLIQSICELFNSDKNKNNAQLIFVSYNTSILDKELLRRDQIWFLEKDRFGSSELFSLAEFKDHKDGKKVRNDASYEKSYLKGIYGAVPRIRDFEVDNGE